MSESVRAPSLSLAADRTTGHRIKYLKVDADTGEEVANEDVVKGYALDKDTFIEVSKEELDEIALGNGCRSGVRFCLRARTLADSGSRREVGEGEYGGSGPLTRTLGDN